MKEKIDYSLVIPVYNSEKSLNELYDRVTKLFKELKVSYEIILVNDSSEDNSWKVMKKLNSKDNKIKIINLMKNFGQHNALMCGFNQVNGNKIITMDDDLQHPPEEIPKLIKKMNRGYEVVYGQYEKKKHYLFRNLGSLFVNKLLGKITGTNFNITSFRIIDRKVIDNIIKFTNYNVIVDVYISNILSKKHISTCLVKHDKRVHGKTNYSITKLSKFAINMILNFTIFPLRFATFVGLFFSMLSIFMGIYYFSQYYFNRVSVSGFTSLIISIAFFSGVILFVLGMVGEYIGRIFMTTNNKPQYIIKDKKL